MVITQDQIKIADKKLEKAFLKAVRSGDAADIAKAFSGVQAEYVHARNFKGNVLQISASNVDLIKDFVVNLIYNYVSFDVTNASKDKLENQFKKCIEVSNIAKRFIYILYTNNSESYNDDAIFIGNFSTLENAKAAAKKYIYSWANSDSIKDMIKFNGGDKNGATELAVKKVPLDYYDPASFWDWSQEDNSEIKDYSLNFSDLGISVSNI